MKPIKKGIKNMTQTSSFDIAKELAIGIAKDQIWAESLIKNISENLLPAFINRSEEDGEPKKALLKGLSKAAIAYEFDTHFALSQTVDKRYAALVVEFCKQIIQEYGCKAPSEIALAEIAACSYVKYLRFGELLNAICEYPDKHHFIAVVSKEVDRSQRSYIAAISSLRQMKAPVIALNVKATTAFIAENQQVNANAQGVKVEGINDGQ